MSNSRVPQSPRPRKTIFGLVWYDFALLALWVAACAAANVIVLVVVMS